MNECERRTHIELFALHTSFSATVVLFTGWNMKKKLSVTTNAAHYKLTTRIHIHKRTPLNWRIMKNMSKNMVTIYSSDMCMRASANLTAFL